jgi:hypothetical protein
LKDIMPSSILFPDLSCDLTPNEFVEGIPMAGKRSPTNRDAEPQRTDDLKLINGIGPGVEKRLNDIGIFTFTQLAALSPADLAAAVAGLAGLSTERIIKQDWIGQARKLAEESAITEAQEKIEAPADSGQANTFKTPVDPSSSSSEDTAPSMTGYHTANFQVELLLDENNYVRSTHVMDVQGKREQTWLSVPNTELLDFMNQSAGVNFASDEPVLVTAEEPEPALAVVEEPEHVPEGVAESTPLTAKLGLTGTLHLRDMKLLTAGSSEPRKLLPHDQRFDVRLTLDLTEITVPTNTPLDYKASIYGKSRSDPSGQIVGETEGTIKPADNVTIDVEGNPLPEGTYRLAARVMLALPGTKSDIMDVIDGGRVQVY